MKRYLRKPPSHFYVMLSGWVSRLIIAPTQLIAIPIFYQKLGLQDFAIFIVLTSLTSWYALMDFGIGTALQNYISEYRAQNKNPAILLTNVFPLIMLLLLILAFAIILLGGLLKAWLFAHLPNTLSSINFDFNLILYCWYFVLLISSKIFFAYQKGFYGYFYQSIAYLALLVAMVLIHILDIHLSLNTALYIWVSPLFLSALIGFVHIYLASGAQFKLFRWDKEFHRQFKNRAFQFWFTSLSANGVLAVDYLVIVKLLSAKDIVTYNIVNKIFIMMLFAYSAFLSGLWPVLAERYARNTQLDYKLAERDIRHGILGGIVFMIFMTTGIIFFRNTIVHLFNMAQEVQLSITLLLLFGVYGCLRVWSDTYAVALQARNLIKIFLIQTPIQAVIAIIAMLILSKFHLIGIMSALIISFVTIPCLILPFYHYKNSGSKY
jgi:O-antigen/teichoic acid export membrane protein